MEFYGEITMRLDFFFRLMRRKWFLMAFLCFNLYLMLPAFAVHIICPSRVCVIDFDSCVSCRVHYEVWTAVACCITAMNLNFTS